MLATTTAIVFVMSKHVFPDTHRYISYCVDRGYKPLGVIKGDLSVAIALLDAKIIQAIVFARHDGQVLDEGPTYGLPDCVSATVRSRNRLAPVSRVAETPWQRRQRLNAYLDDAARRLRRGCGEHPPSIIRVIDGGAG